MSGPIFLKSCPPKVSDKRKWVVITASWVYLLYNLVRNACCGHNLPNTPLPDLVRLRRGLANIQQGTQIPCSRLGNDMVWWPYWGYPPNLLGLEYNGQSPCLQSSGSRLAAHQATTTMFQVWQWSQAIHTYQKLSSDVQGCPKTDP